MNANVAGGAPTTETINIEQMVLVVEINGAISLTAVDGITLRGDIETSNEENDTDVNFTYAVKINGSVTIDTTLRLRMEQLNSQAL